MDNMESRGKWKEAVTIYLMEEFIFGMGEKMCSKSVDENLRGKKGI